MTATAKPTRRKRTKYFRNLADGIWLEAEVSPCVFMYPGYPLQLTVRLRDISGRNLGDVHPTDRSKKATTYSDADAKRLLASVQFKPCSRCATPAFDPASVKTNRGGLCEPCFLAHLKARLAEALEVERQEIAARDLLMKSEGMAVRLTAWIHPDHGDDYQIDWYFEARPTPADIQKLLRQKGSTILDDFAIIEL